MNKTKIENRRAMLPLLKLLDENDITIKILEHPIPDPRKIQHSLGEYVIKCCIYENENEKEHYYLELRSFVKKEILRECKNNNIPIDKDLTCSVGRIFTISGKRRINAPKRLWHKNEITNKLEPPMIHTFKLIL